MHHVPITFDYQGQTYTGVFVGGSGSGGAAYDHWHLMIDQYYNGALHYSGHAGGWLFDSNSGKFKELEDYFEGYMVGWFG